MVKTNETSTTQIDIQTLLTKIGLSQETLMHDLLSQSELLLEASKYKIQKMRRRIEAEETLSQARLDAAQEIRSREDVKITEKFVEEEITRSERVQKARKDYEEAKVMEAWAGFVRDSFYERGSMGKAIVQLIGAEAALDSGFIRGELERLGIGRLRESLERKRPLGVKLKT
mgnify:CR=1 FL=1